MFFRYVEIVSYYSYPWRARGFLLKLGLYSGPESYDVFNSSICSPFFATSSLTFLKSGRNTKAVLLVVPQGITRYPC